jgi:triosephosphate isomerase
MFDFVNNSVSNINTWVIGNWKMNGRLQNNENYLEELLPKIKNLTKDNSLFFGLAVPNLYLFQFSNRLLDCNLNLGVQDVSSENNEGAFTGDISAKMFNEFDCSFAIIGHSEIRKKYNESDLNLVNKVKVSIKNKILPVVCVGETLEDREEGNASKIISAQIKHFTLGLSEAELSNCIFAYEPLWAIGSGKNAEPTDAESMHRLIRCEFVKVLGSDAVEKIKILYGGSVKAENAERYFLQPGVDGALVGGASLDALEFYKIIDKAVGTSLNK